MADVTVKRTEDFERTVRGRMLKVRSGLGVSSFGMQVIDLPPNADRYPEHDHSFDGQEEVYTVLEGSATLLAGGEQYELDPGVFARVGPDESRRIVTGESPATVLVLGGVPGRPFEAVQFTDEGEPDPMAEAR
ncbi:MAG: cupin domain-containing protein [Solirubrobacterales bacterium]